ncbi:hypothetical protein HK104_003910 [Borealophlyctis nickersoniae]|nr:hypothetical protein HK104_003910 [Borealophlyctis nickersoniae]
MTQVKVKVESVDEKETVAIEPKPDETVIKAEEEAKLKVETIDGRDTIVIDLAEYKLDDVKVLEDAPQDHFRNSVYTAVLGGNMMDSIPVPRAWKYGDGQPYIRAKMTWNPQLPAFPGYHGVIYSQTPIGQSQIQVAVQHKTCSVGFRYCGRYHIRASGFLSPTEIFKMPVECINTWLTEMKGKVWGAEWITGAGLPADADDQMILAALRSGTLKMCYTVLQFVDFDRNLYNLLKHEDERQALTRGGKKKKMKGSGGQKKKRKVSNVSKDE